MKEGIVITPPKELRVARAGEWEGLVGPEIVVSSERSNLLAFLTKVTNEYAEAQRKVPGPRHLFFRQTDLPSPIIRVDMPLVTGFVPNYQGIFEIEGRPAGLGLDSVLFPGHRDNFKGYVQQLSQQLGKDLAVKMFKYEQDSVNDPGGEKKEFANAMGIPFYDIDEEPEKPDQFLYFVYGNSGDRAKLKDFEGRSLFPVRTDGDKEYLVHMNRATGASSSLVESMMAGNIPFVLKPRKGMWAQNIYPFLGRGINVDGQSTITKIRTLYEEDRVNSFLLQPFIPPGTIEINGKHLFAMARVYAFANVTEGKYDVSNGIYVARNNLRLHGTSDAITGELVFK